MLVKTGHEKSVEIYDDVIRGVLGIYPEEKLLNRSFFENIFNLKYLSYKDLLKECEAILIPWQTFFLTPDNLKIQTEHIEKSRSNKFSPKFFAKRSGIGKITSKRIIDRLIRLQNFITNNYKLPKNQFCGLFKNTTLPESIKIFSDFFEIDTKKLSSKSADVVLKYLIDMAELKNINISRGVLRGGILPEVKGVNEVYKNTSGFVIKDECVPFIFLPDEINPDEVTGRRIYTLVYLLVCIGLDDYNFYIEKKFKVSALKMSGSDNIKHSIVTGILLPNEETEKLRGEKISKTVISQLTSKYKITPTAVITTLRRRGIIKTKEEYESLLPEPYKPIKSLPSPRKHAKITTSVEKFCGKTVYNLINAGIKNKILKSVEAQYLIFGGVKKAKYKEYCKLIGV
jgi:hypothetical protein